jgi:hypothetical protein
MFKMSRVGAVLGLVFYVVEQISQILDGSVRNPTPIIIILVALILVNAARGAFAFHRLAATATDAASN